MHDFELEARSRGFQCIAGVDEAGRGPLAGPVVAAAVVFPPDVSLTGVDDSKKLTEGQRERLFPEIQRAAKAWAVAVVDVPTIDSINILQAALLAMRQAVEQLRPAADFLYIDGNRKIETSLPQETLIGGDSRCRSIAAASILAKVTRDRLMLEFHETYPGYGFDRHKGYGTVLHRDRIREMGPCEIHRKTFKGVREFV